MKKISLTHPLEIADVSAGPILGRVGITFCPGKYDQHAMSGYWDRDLAIDLDSQFRFLTIPHLGRPIAIVVMIQAIFHLSLYSEIEIVSRGNGNKNLPYLIGEFANNNIGAASAAGIFAVILANIVAIFLLRMVGKTLME